MANDPTASGHLKQKDTNHIGRLPGNSQEKKFSTGMIVYKRDTGMAFEVVSVSHANGIKHHNLVCLETGSRIYLSKFALEKDYTDKNIKLEKFGLRIVKRLSEMCT